MDKIIELLNQMTALNTAEYNIRRMHTFNYITEDQKISVQVRITTEMSKIIKSIQQELNG